MSGVHMPGITWEMGSHSPGDISALSDVTLVTRAGAAPLLALWQLPVPGMVLGPLHLLLS